MQNATAEGFRLSPQQKNLWSLQQAAAGQPYRAVCAILLEGDLQQGALKKALYDVVQRHEILRTTFHRPAGIKTPFQVVSNNAHPSWQDIDLTHLDAAHQDHRIEVSLAEESARLFDFERGPLLRVNLFKLSPGSPAGQPGWGGRNNRRVMMVSLPALCADSATLANFVAELSRAYELCLNNQECGDEPMQYADFAEWQNELLEADDEQAKTGKDYWQKQDAASVSAPALLLERRLVASQAFKPNSVPVALDSSMLEKIEAIAREYEASISAVLFACWQALVWRLSRQPDFVMLTLCDGRKFDDLQSAFGLYAKYLPIRCQLADGPFTEQLRPAHQALNEANEWQEYFDPGAFSVAASDAIAFEFEERPSLNATAYTAPGDQDAGEVSFSVASQYVCIDPFKLKLSCFLSGNSLSSKLHYDQRVFDGETVARMAGYFLRLVARTLVCDPSKTEVSAIEILSRDERQQLLVDFNETTVEYSDSKCIHELFEMQVEKTPTAPAVVCGEQQLSYFELNVRANQLAHLLRRRGVGPSARVGLCMQRSGDMIVGLLGILKAGGAYVPLNPEHPPARLALQLAESEARVCLTNDNSAPAWLEFDGETIDLERDRESLRSEPALNPELITNPEALIYVIYTSGSTGVPKGVAVRHRNLVNYTQFIRQRLPVDSSLHFATVSTISADLGNTCIFPSLISGGCLHILSYDVAMEGTLFSEYIARHPIDVLKIVPSHFNALLASSDGRNVFPAKYLILGGEALSWELVSTISATNHTCKLINHYGPTETTVGSLTFNVDEQYVSPYSLTVPIGRAIANTRCYILDRRMQPVPIGAAGELYLGGAGVAAGYLNQATETALRFVPDPFSTNSNGRLYRTGDLARYLPDGNIEFLGRVDQQVKVRGYRVELGEIEAVLAEHPQVRQAVVVVRHDDSQEKVVAYVVASGAMPPAPDDLRRVLKQKLPDYMIPSAFVYLRSLPLTANGKVDRAALPAPNETRSGNERTFVGPRTPVEKELAAIWATLLKTSEVGVNDNFFALGGHSLLATQVISRMRKAFQTEIPLRSIFESPTVAELAIKIESAIHPATADLLEQLEALEALSDEEAERLLALENNNIR
jgi:amino acid adenylation domain-containing protein